MFLEPGNTLWESLEALIADEGAELYDVEKAGTSLKIFVDSREEGKRITSGDCSKICRRLMVHFSAEGEKFGLGNEPYIEVSSPGINRHLRLPKHFQNAVGQRVRCSGLDDAAQKTSTIGVLEKTDGEAVELLDEQTNARVVFRMSGISKANVEYRFG